MSLGGCAAASPPTTMSHAGPLGPRAARGPVAQASASTPPRLDVFCEASDDCPASIGMVVFPGGDEPERCTGTLVGPSLILTAGHCVAGAGGRVGTLEPEVSGWIAFPESGPYPASWHRVVEVVAIQDGKGEVLAMDYALLRLRREAARPVVPTNAETPVPGSIIRIALVTPHPVYSTQHALRTRLCRVATSAAAEQALGRAARRVGWLRDCPIEPGNSGAPVFDAAGRVRALVHGGSHPFFGIGVTSALPVLPALPAAP